MLTVRRRAIGAAVVSAALLALVTTASLAETDSGPPPRIVRSLLEIRQRDVVVQKSDISCGAAALATVLTYEYGDPVSEREIALGLIRRTEYLDDPLSVRARGGFSLLDLKRVAEARGYEAVGYGNLTLQDLAALAPVIVPVRFKGNDHFVVFRGIRGDRVALGDPGWGNRTLPVKTFESAWGAFHDLGRVGLVVKRQPRSEVPRDSVILPRPLLHAEPR